MSSENPVVVAHRGGAGLGPENTAAACARSLALGIRRLEVDVRATADGVCVALHDADLRRTGGISARVADLPWDALRALPVQGERVPRIEELLAAFPGASFVADLKDRRAVPGLARAVREQRAGDRVRLAGNDDDLLVDAAAVVGVEVTMGWRSLSRLVAAARLGTPAWGVRRAGYVHVPLRLGRVPVFAGRLVAMAHDLGARVLVGTVDDPADMRRLLDAGVDGLITDRPDVAGGVLLERGLCCLSGAQEPAGSRAPVPPARAAGPAPGLRTPAPNGA